MSGRVKGALIAGAVLAALGLGGAAVAGAAGEGEAERAITGPALDEATRAALAHTGGGEVTGTEVGDEEGAYEVEVTLDGRQTDVHLDESFSVVSAAADREDGD
jgi:hypothetical protein